MDDATANTPSAPGFAGGAAPDTYFAPAARATPREIARSLDALAESPLIRAIQESIDGYLMILNAQRQVLAVNGQLLRDLGFGGSDCTTGRRPGEILSCVHSSETPGGCGTSKSCSTCGAVLSILASQREGRPVTDECLATVHRGDNSEAVEFRVRASPVRVGDQELTVLVLHDISGDKRRDALERVFFHDILNTIGGLQGWSSLLAHDVGDPKEMAARIVFLSQRLAREVRDQRALLEAENGTLRIQRESESVKAILVSLPPIFEAHAVAKGKALVMPDVSPDERVVTDASLLLRILTNMVKNAFEASAPGECVRVDFERRDGQVVFSVHNEGAMPETVALRVFQRSFSTKGGQGRGLGTYSMKMFGERYLGGKVGFETSLEAGTTFFIRLPEAQGR